MVWVWVGVWVGQAYVAESAGPPPPQTQNVVTLVDVSTFGELCISQQKFRERRELGGAESSVAEEPIATLLVEQVSLC